MFQQLKVPSSLSRHGECKLAEQWTKRSNHVSQKVHTGGNMPQANKVTNTDKQKRIAQPLMKRETAAAKTATRKKPISSAILVKGSSLDKKAVSKKPAASPKKALSGAIQKVTAIGKKAGAKLSKVAGSAKTRAKATRSASVGSQSRMH